MSDEVKATSAGLYSEALARGNQWPTEQDATLRIFREVPKTPQIAMHNRRFLARVVRSLVRDYGIDQILDIGSGKPLPPNVHEVAQGLNPAARVVYCDNSPKVLPHLYELANSSAPEGEVAVLDADLRDPGSIIHSRVVRDVLDFDRPIGLLLVSVMLFVADEEDPAGIVKELVDALPPGSFVAFSQGSREIDEETSLKLERLWAEHGIYTRTRTMSEVEAVFAGAGIEILEPGIVTTSHWRPDDPVNLPPITDSCFHAFLARKL